LKLAGKGVQVSWFRSGGDAPSYYEIVYASTEIINYVKVPGTNSIYTIPRLLPGMIYTISVRGYYSNSDADSFSDSDNIWVPDMPVFKFQILFNGVISCTDLRSNLENIRTQLANALNSSCHCLSDADRLALIVHQCPYGKADNQVALVYGWIYDTSDQPGEKYFPIMQKMVGKATFSASSQKLVVTQTCDMNKYGSQCPPLPVAANIGAPSNGDVGPSTAAIIVLIIVAIVACVLLAVILVILILKYKAKKQALKSDVALSSSAVAFSETTKKVEGNEEDHNELQKDF
jgi:ABC-type antimicrobial peptide transport system permease subunit